MKFTVVLLAALCVSSSWAVKVTKPEDPKDKREAPVGYPGISGHNYPSPSHGQEEASAISIGAGYSVGGAKPTYSLEGSSGGAQYQLSPEALQPSSHGTIQLAPITLQPSHGQAFASSDLSQLMSQLSHGLNTGALTLQGDSIQQAGHGGGQELSLSPYSFSGPKFQQYAVAEQPSVPSYAAGTKGLGSYSTGPVLFSPSESHGQSQGLTYGIPSSGHSLGGASGAGHAFLSSPSSGHSFGGLSASSLSGGHSLGDGAFSLGGSGHSLAGLSFGGPGQSFGGSGHSFGGSGQSFGGSGHSLGGSGQSFGGSIKGLSAGYGAPSKNSFKPSAFLGASVQGESGHGLSSLSGSYGSPSFGAFGDSHGVLSLSSGGHGASLGALSSGGHGASLGGSFPSFGSGSSKFLAPSYLPAKSQAFGSPAESAASFASDGHFASPPGTTYGVPTSSYGLSSSAAQSASSSSPQYYVPSKSSFPSFSGGSSSYRGSSSGHSPLSSLSSGPKHIYSSRFAHPKDIQGSHSESSYNTIKYSEELKPRGH